jgi:type III pantothenate kinase
MLLTVDIGNTQTAMGLFDGEELVAHWVFNTRAQDTADEVQFLLVGQFDLNGLDCSICDDVVIASVVPALTECWERVAQRVTGREPIVVGPGIKTGIAMRYDNPAEVGADRIADAMAAIDFVGAPVVVVDLGTTTNIEVIDKSGHFRGGIIAPGLGTGAEAMFSHAARLPQVDIVNPGHAVGTNTVDAMRSGIVYGEVARIDGLVRRIFDELGYETPVIATGGFSGLITDISQTITRREPRLTLYGLKLVYEKNTQV